MILVNRFELGTDFDLEEVDFKAFSIRNLEAKEFLSTSINNYPQKYVIS